ncbi:TIGR03617 family F420-dependent LLM class oxidoreductase [Nocardioides lianchengensis]|uniref:Probable F420-dependent oxidoreductase, MSMEG_2256 family n=1 Tax=Nocardioides lianchengensis TaxID=1045774 RepID=A0A1G7BIT4_9ACTN|nr:TIGR03617 family F420-dependent LLM class oxidoreductase [Nocardioides lianchengensis]NYG08978.1 putative F420-dependent oxidoreductase [Nocardioides lianchengensis]SDE27038.1 probable F420-dependent oxidoreductase, MSMEG_2256 family [Nocardioides lianchengensis]
MKIDLGLIGSSAVDCGPAAATAETQGFDGVWASESVTDAFLQSQAALMATSQVSVGTAIAVAFARNPMSVAYLSWDLAAMSQGRFVLGLGSQIQAHVERRFSMPWSAPAGRMREFLLALDAIFTAWRDGTRLDFQGEHYQHTLMTPVFTPHHHEHRIPTMIAAVGARMTELGGELCDGLLLHGMTTTSYLDTVTLPAVERGLATSGRDRDALELYAPIFMVMGDTEEQVADLTRRTREQIAFYASTPAYRPVLASVGYDELQPELQAMSRAGRWAEMGDLVDDRLLGEIALVGTPEEMPRLAKERFGGRLDRLSSYFDWPVDDPDRLRDILAAFADDPAPAAR